jgi:AcrR family transcriptional regulator
MPLDADDATDSVRARLLQAALTSFLADDYHKVSTRLIADKAGANVAMIRYYFGNKEGLYEEMIRQTLQPLLQVLDGAMLNTPDGFQSFFKLYYDTMAARPEFPRLILKVVALNQGPGRRFIQQLLERGRTRGARKVGELKQAGQFDTTLDPDVVRMAFISLAMMPMLLKDIFEEQMERPMDAAFLDHLARFHGHLFHTGLAPQAQVPPPSFQQPPLAEPKP